MSAPRPAAPGASGVGARPELAEVERLLERFDRVPVYIELVADCLTPVEAMLRLGTEGNCFLLESVEGGEHVGRWSILGRDPASQIRSEPSRDPLSELEALVRGRVVAALPELSEVPFLGGAVGFLGYEAASRYERLPAPARDPLGIADSWFGVFDTVVVMDHVQQRLLLVTSVAPADGAGVAAAYAAAVERLEGLCARLEGGQPAALHPRVALRIDPRAYEEATNRSREGFRDAVTRAREYIVAGDIFQVQVSRRFTLPLHSDAFTLYRALRAVNPSPYMFFLSSPECVLVGASPEMLVRVTGSRVQYHPIAGTRRRGRDAEHEARMEAELRGSEKELAEHLMLVDLGRNDLGRVCAFGSVRVTEMMQVERYSHVMHLVSSIEGRLRPECTSLDALRACFPAGTVTGAPKIRAMEIIAELEGETRGPYSGAVGYVGYGGNLDTAIALRTVVVRDGVAHVQAAAGVVADSDPEQEAVEVDNKVSASLLAVGEANAW
jgi:anthranilate synthase component I